VLLLLLLLRPPLRQWQLRETDRLHFLLMVRVGRRPLLLLPLLLLRHLLLPNPPLRQRQL